jgi:hypothetical protein
MTAGDFEGDIYTVIIFSRGQTIKQGSDLVGVSQA